MTFRIKSTVGAALAALLLITAAPAAQADPEFEATNSSGTVSGSDTLDMHIGTEAGTLTCSETAFSGSYSSKKFSTLRLHPTFGKCKAFGFISATVNTEKCDFIFNPYEKIIELAYNAKLSVDCPAGNAIKVTASTCAMQIKDNALTQELERAEIVDLGGDIFIDPMLNSLSYEVTTDGFLCPFSGTGTKFGGTYESTGEIDISAAGSEEIAVVGS